MLDIEALKDLGSRTDYTRTEKLLFCLAVESKAPKQIAQIKEIAAKAGIRAAASWNISSLLAASGGLAIRTDQGWELSPEGKKQVGTLAGHRISGPQFTVSTTLRHHLLKLKEPKVAAFVEEAISCFEAKLYRAAAVLSWVGAVAVLYDHVVKHELAAFNAEALRRNAKWKEAKNADGLARMEEFEFLQVLEAIGVLGKSVKQELEGCLRLRNGSGHPNSLVVGASRVAGHIETLILNVFSRFNA